MLQPPELLIAKHDLGSVDSGVASLDGWLRRHALQNQRSGPSRTFVACDHIRVVAYYVLAASAIAPDAATDRFRRNMPDPLPVAVLGRLAIDKTQQGMGLGRALFRDATLRTLGAADSIGIRGMLVHAMSDDPRAIYVGLGLDMSPLEPDDADGDGGRLEGRVGPMTPRLIRGDFQHSAQPRRCLNWMQRAAMIR